MHIRILLTTLVLFFLFQSVHAQDTLKHGGKHIHKTHINDSTHMSQSTHVVHIKDTAQVHKKHTAIIMPKYPRNGYVAIMGGLSFPLAAYASNEGAATGSVFSISAAFPGITSHSGIAFKFDYGVNGFNQTRLEGIENTIAGFSSINCTVPDPGHCSYSSFLTGLYITYPKKHITIDLRFLAGVMVANIPEIDIIYNDQTGNNSGINEQGASTASAFAFDLGFELRYSIKPRFCIILSADYLHAVPSFTIVNTGSTLSSYGSIETNNGGTEVTTDQPFNLFNLSVGVGYVISAKRVNPKTN